MREQRRAIRGRPVKSAERFFLGSFWSFYTCWNGKSYWLHEPTGTVIRASGDDKPSARSPEEKLEYDRNYIRLRRQANPAYCHGY